MEEIKFRGKTARGSEWVYGFYFEQGNGCDAVLSYISRICDSPHIDASTLGQYTGVKDKNGKESFKHDIIKVYTDNGFYTDEWIGEIVFEKGQFGIRHGFEYKNFYPLSAFFKATKTEYISNVGEVVVESKPMFEVIGNIYDNPELLN